MKELKFPKPKKVSTTKLHKRAAELFSLYIRRRGRCQLAGIDGVQCGGSLQCAHIVTRGIHHLAFDEKNALCLCAGHHRYYTTKSHAWFWYIIPTFFPDQYKHVQELMNKTIPMKRNDYESVIATLESLMRQ